MADLPKDLEDLLYTVEARVAEDELKQDLELICTKCKKHLCDIEHEDTLDVLVRVVLGHAAGTDPGGKCIETVETDLL